MYILNTSFHVADSYVNQFVSWARDIYIPAALASGHLVDPLFTRIMLQVEPGTTSFAIHFHCPSVDRAQEWHDTEAARMKEALHKQLQGGVLYFTTFMEKVELL